MFIWFRSSGAGPGVVNEVEFVATGCCLWKEAQENFLATTSVQLSHIDGGETIHTGEISESRVEPHAMGP